MSRNSWPSGASTSLTKPSGAGSERFEPLFARNLRRLRPKPSDIRHLDEVAVSIGASACGSGHNTIHVSPYLISRRTLRAFRAEAAQAWQIATDVAPRL